MVGEGNDLTGERFGGRSVDCGGEFRGVLWERMSEASEYGEALGNGMLRPSGLGGTGCGHEGAERQRRSPGARASRMGGGPGHQGVRRSSEGVEHDAAAREGVVQAAWAPRSSSRRRELMRALSKMTGRPLPGGGCRRRRGTPSSSSNLFCGRR